MATATPTFSLNHSNAPLLAFIFDGLCRINQEVRHARMEAERDGLAEELGTSDDRLLSAALMIAAQAVGHLQPTLDFYDKQANPGIFTYDHLDHSEDAGVANCASLPAFIWRFLDAEPSLWLLAAEHLKPEELPMEKIIADWRQQNDLI